MESFTPHILGLLGFDFIVCIFLFKNVSAWVWIDNAWVFIK